MPVKKTTRRDARGGHTKPQLKNPKGPETILIEWENAPGAFPLKDSQKEAYCIGISRGLQKGKAALLAGYPPNTAAQRPWHLHKKQEVVDRIDFLTKQAAAYEGNLEKIREDLFGSQKPTLLEGVTRKWLVWEFFVNAQLSRENGAFRDANFALAYIAKLSGDLPEEMPMPTDYALRKKRIIDPSIQRANERDADNDIPAAEIPKKHQSTSPVGRDAGRGSEEEDDVLIRAPGSIGGTD